MDIIDILYYLLFIVVGFLSGSVYYSILIPKIFLKKDIVKLSKDGNPGTANVFSSCGVWLGLLCVLLELLKSSIPVLLGVLLLDSSNILFFLVIIAPVVGHAIGIFNHFHGGKCICPIFGTLLGVLPVSFVVLVLAFFYILFAGIIRIKPHRITSIVTFAVFGVVSLTYLLILGKYSIAIACGIESLTAIYKHNKKFEKNYMGNKEVNPNL